MKFPQGSNSPAKGNPAGQFTPVPVMFQPVARSRFLFPISCSPIKGRRQSSRKVTKERDSLHRGYIARSLQSTGTDDRKHHIPLPARTLPGERNDKFKNCFNKKRMTEQRKAISENAKADYLSLPAHRHPGHHPDAEDREDQENRKCFPFPEKTKVAGRNYFTLPLQCARPI